MRVLFLVHVEEMFRGHFPDRMYVNRLVRACRSGRYDRVICLVSGVQDYEPIIELQGERIERWDWGWGYEPEVFNGDVEEECWVIEAPNSAHDYTWVPPEVRDPSAWSGVEISVGGGYDGECLADWEAVLEHQGLRYRRVEGYIYGA